MNIIEQLISVIYPNKCIFCKQIIDSQAAAVNNYVCEKCSKNLPIIPLTIRDIHDRNEESGKYIIEYSFDKCISYFYYKDVVKRAIGDFKFNGKQSYSKPFADYIFRMINESLDEVNFDIIAYVPMHKLSKRKRGYNQARLLAVELSKLLKIPISDDILLKTRKNKNQHTLKLSLRCENVKGVYSAQNKSKILGKNILLVDDIVTSGYTTSECAKVLKESGADKVYCVSIAAADSKNL